MPSRASPCTTLAIALLASTLARAQGTSKPSALPGFELEQLEANPGRGTLLIGSGELMSPGGLRLMVLSNYQYQPLVLRTGQEQLEVLKHRVVGVLSGSYTVLPWLEVGAQLPVVLWQRGADLSGENIASPSSQGLGTPMVHARLGLLSQRTQQPVNLSLDVGLGLPLGSEMALARDPGPRIRSQLALSGRLGPLRPALEAGILLRPSTPLDPAGTHTVGGPEIRLGAALSTGGTRLGAELAARASLPLDPTEASVEVLGGLRYRPRPELELFALGGPGLGSMAGTPRFRAVLGLAYVMEPPPRIEILEDAPPPPLHFAESPPRAPAGGSETSSRPVNTWELSALPPTNALDTSPDGLPQDLEPPPASSGAPPGSQRPFLAGHREQLVLRGTVLFHHASAELPEELPVLDRVALMLQQMPENAIVLIEGHADAEGSDAFNRTLSLRRAQAVQHHLVSRGVSSSRLRTRGLGSTWPASSNTTEEGRQRNRRVEVLILTEPPAPAVSGTPPL